MTARLWPANRRWTLYQNDAESLLAEFAGQEEDLFTQDDDQDVTIVETRDGTVCRDRDCTNLDQVLQYIQVFLSGHVMISELS
jgi:hypothetical protein